MGWGGVDKRDERSKYSPEALAFQQHTNFFRYLCLHHQHASLPHANHNVKDIEGTLAPQRVQQDVQRHKRPRTTHPGRAVDQEGDPLALVVQFAHFPQELQHLCGLRYPVVWPCGEVVMGHSEWICVLVHFLQRLERVFKKMAELGREEKEGRRGGRRDRVG